MKDEVTYKSQRQTIQIGDISLEVAMFPDGQYVFSQSEVAKVVDKNESSIRSFRQSKRLKAMLTEDSQFVNLTIEGSNKPIVPVSLEVAALYWQKCATLGNIKAQALVIALVKHSLYELVDRAFAVRRTQQERANQLLDDLSEPGVARIELMRRSLEHQVVNCPPETTTERELKLKIRLAELELERERLRQCRNHSLDGNGLSAEEINGIGIVSWEAVNWTQKTLDSPTFQAAFFEICRLGYSFNSHHWQRLKLSDYIQVLPWQTFNSLAKEIKQLRSEQD